MNRPARFIPLLVLLALCGFAAPAPGLPCIHPLDFTPDFSATYWWKTDGTTQIDGLAPSDAFLRVDQADLYDPTADRTLFVYLMQNLAYEPSHGVNGLSGFDLLDLTPFHYAYEATPFDPVTGNLWTQGSGPAQEFSPDWEAPWGDPFTGPDTQGIFPDGEGPAGAASFAGFAFSVDGHAVAGSVAAEVHSWMLPAGVGARGEPVDSRSGVVSGPVGLVPEPGTLALLALGVAGLAALRRRR